MTTHHFRPPISNPDFALAVSFLDHGNAEGLKAHLKAHPELIHARVTADEAYQDGYFKHPTLLHFVAYNPWDVQRWKEQNFEVPENIVELTSILLDAGSDPDALCGEVEKDGGGTTLGLVTSGSPLFEAGLHMEMVACLLNAGADPETGVSSAISYNKWEMLQQLLDAGAEKSLSVLAALGSVEELEKALSGVTGQPLTDALYAAVTKGNSEHSKRLLDHGADPNGFPTFHPHATVTHQAAFIGDLERLKLLIAQGADITIQDKVFQADVMSWAGQAGHTHLQEYLFEQGYQATPQQLAAWGLSGGLEKWLCDNPGKIDEVGDWGTCLQQASFHGRTACIQVLIAEGADVNKGEGGDRVPGAGKTPLAKALFQGHADAAALLQSCGAVSDLS